ncbi:GTP cyclohydrolase I FolE2 [Thermogymnomonas acidicola]|uniref:GTP cyclohydrolase MptA n=1 Tax=Thermogymnomonas acidicola TaxID=399579 RepID=A0AA37BRP5_9ARCH|nr:GTP cyclohydrolase MptA [Thermogymnomonas acidicola]GGM74485.1 GTP cyclohydrolase I FolE2 [Thermogymnomonas acidicola]
MQIPDVQSQTPHFRIPIQQVGVRGVQAPVTLVRGGKRIPAFVSFDAFVGIPGERRGADLSRLLEAIGAVVSSEHSGLESLSGRVCMEIMERMPYATGIDVTVASNYFRERDRGAGSYVKYELLGETRLSGDGEFSRLGVTVLTMNACPCAMETTRALVLDARPELSDALREMPSVTHNQRNRVRVITQVSEEHQVEADDLIDTVEGVVGGALLSVLKRMDEGKFVYRAHSRPMFVEDIVREVAASLAERFRDMPDSYTLEVSSESDESIHPHNAYARISTTYGEIRNIGREGLRV